MNSKMRRLLWRHVLTIAAVVMVVLFVAAIITGRIGFLRTAPKYERPSSEKILERLPEVTGHSAQEKASKEVASDSRVARWNEDGIFWAKARYEVDEMTNTDFLVYEVALRIDVKIVTATTRKDMEHKMNLVLWRIVRESLAGEDVLTQPNKIVVILYLFIGDVPVKDSNLMYVFPAQRFQEILAATDPDQITAFAGKPKPVVPSVPNVGPLWIPPPPIPNQ